MNLTGLRVLIVEDEPIVAMLIQAYLEDLGCKVVATAFRLREALEQAAILDFDAATLDVNLAGELSYPVARVLRDRQVPFLFATGYGTSGAPPDLEGAPILSKPFQQEQLAALLLEACSRAEHDPK
jgi:CheY-like chemotaxis protein